MTFYQQYTRARAQMEGGDWKLRSEITDLQAHIATLEASAAELAEALAHLLADVEYAQTQIEPGLIGHRQVNAAKEALTRWKKGTK